VSNGLSGRSVIVTGAAQMGTVLKLLMQPVSVYDTCAPGVPGVHRKASAGQVLAKHVGQANIVIDDQQGLAHDGSWTAAPHQR
jgi:hypothetical protein